jgi:hypothetical protein
MATFVLEIDVFVEAEEGNSGIQTRSHFDRMHLTEKERFMVDNVK